MFNIGFTELLILGLIALIFIGPNQLPEVARTLGRLLNEWKRATSDFQSTLTSHVTEDVSKRWQETRAQNADPSTGEPVVSDAEAVKEAEEYAKHIGSPDGQLHNHADVDPVLPTGTRKNES